MEKSFEDDHCVITRAFPMLSYDKEKRQATFVAATENRVVDKAGPQFLRISGIDLTRYSKNPVVIDSHNRGSIDSILGRAEMTKEGRQLIARVTFAPTPQGNKANDLAACGMLNAGSVGFIPNKSTVRELYDGETDGEGEYALKGPGRVVNNSLLFEFSLLPVGADEDAIMRSFTKENAVEKKDEKKDEKPALQPTAIETTSRDIRALAGENEALRTIAERCILEGRSIDEARKELLAEHTKRSAPVGTPDAPKPPENNEKKEEKREITDDVLLRSLTGSLNS